MKRSLFVLTFGLLICARAIAGIDKHPQREFIFEHLKRIASTRADETEHHFFILRRKDGDWIYWREGRLIWRTELDPFYETKGKGEITARAVWTLRFSLHKATDLDKHVVPTADDVHGSSCLVPKVYAANIVYECVLDGELVEIKQAPKLMGGGPLITVQEPVPKAEP
jgi:hypothetical protein